MTLISVSMSHSGPDVPETDLEFELGGKLIRAMNFIQAKYLIPTIKLSTYRFLPLKLILSYIAFYLSFIKENEASIFSLNILLSHWISVLSSYLTPGSNREKFLL